jgi:fanconi-associated nuclease 1
MPGFSCSIDLPHFSRYVRLFLRKTAAWHRINLLGYHSDVTSIESTVADLQSSRKIPTVAPDEQHNPGELEPLEAVPLGTTFTFADDSDSFINTLEEASTLLRLDELKNLSREAKVQGKNKSELMYNLRRTSQQQGGIGWNTLKRSNTGGSTRSSTAEQSDGDTTPLEEAEVGVNRDGHFVRKILAETGPCIRLSPAPLKLFERVHLVFYRSTEWTEKSLTTIILARIARRNFPEYIVSRSAQIFPSRSRLLEFEAALRTQHRVDSILEFNGPPSREDLETILEIHEEVYPRWRILVQEEQQKEDSIYLSGEGAYLRRLSPAWVYTRIIHKATGILGRYKKHEQEHSVLEELLAQTLFHTARRGAWYQRKALIEEHYLWSLRPSEGRDEEYQKKHWRRIALQTCEMGLEDPLVHLIFQYDLQKRVIKLEKALRIAKRHQHDFSHVRLARPAEVTVEGVKLVRESDQSPAPVPSENTKPPLVRSRSSGSNFGTKRGGKTIWEDPLEDDAPCGVEAMCLSHYRSQGWKGYHSEGGIVRTLFALLFYDILFAYVPHVFQTAYQTCPLDLHCPEAFYAARLSEINARLAAISNGQAEELAMKVWQEHVERQTCVIGLDWSFASEDLVEILRCFQGEALATVCKIMAQEYSQRGGGIPDLFLWHPEKQAVKFVEVKSENDRLSDTQRLWIHVLTGAGVSVELCHAVAKEVKVTP